MLSPTGQYHLPISSPTSPPIPIPHPIPTPLILLMHLLITLPPPILPPPNLTKFSPPIHHIPHTPLHTPLRHHSNQQGQPSPKYQSVHNLNPKYHYPPQKIENLHRYKQKEEQDADGENSRRVFGEYSGAVEVGEHERVGFSLCGIDETADGP